MEETKTETKRKLRRVYSVRMKLVLDWWGEELKRDPPEGIGKTMVAKGVIAALMNSTSYVLGSDIGTLNKRFKENESLRCDVFTPTQAHGLIKEWVPSVLRKRIVGERVLVRLRECGEIWWELRDVNEKPVVLYRLSEMDWDESKKMTTWSKLI